MNLLPIFYLEMAAYIFNFIILSEIYFLNMLTHKKHQITNGIPDAATMQVRRAFHKLGTYFTPQIIL